MPGNLDPQGPKLNSTWSVIKPSAGPHTVGFDGITDTIAVTTKLKGIIDHSKVGKYELDKSLKSIYDRQWEEAARSNDPVKM